tara:strand:+ start:526 stop:1053 length:528 start_codon:yes stop_codon:yes gene_type:complete
MNYKQAKKHFKNEWQKTATEIDHLIYPKGSIDLDGLLKWVREDAKTDEGMPKRYALIFHIFNPNGVANQFPKSEILSTEDFYFINEEGEERFATGLETLSNKFDNYHFKCIQKAFHTGGRDSKNYSWWSFRYDLNAIRIDIEEAWRSIARSKFPTKAREIARARLSEIKNTEEVA